jgi:hypothetical protein
LPRYEKPLEDIRFGDLFESQVLFDAFLKADAAQLGSHQMGEPLRKRLAAQYNRPEIANAAEAIAFSGLLPKRPDQDHILAHGRSCRAAMISDDCEIEDALHRRGKEPGGRLLFAAIRNVTIEEVDALREEPAFGHFPLPPEDPLVRSPGVIDLNRLFMVTTRDIAATTRFATLSDEAAEELAVSWAAFATRHGPLAGLKNAEKLAKLLAGGRNGNVEEKHLAASRLVSELINLAWLLEGDALGEVSEAFDADNVDPSQPIARVIEVVRKLLESAAGALEALTSSEEERIRGS